MQEVGADAVREHRDVVQHRDAEQVVDLLAREELRLVDEQARDVGGRPRESDQFVVRVAHVRAVLGEEVARVVVRADQEVDGTRHAEPARDLVSALGVDRGLREQHVLAALLVVVRGLQQRRRLARVHRSVAEVEFGHPVSLRNSDDR